MAFMASGGYKGIGAQVPNVKVCATTLCRQSASYAAVLSMMIQAADDVLGITDIPLICMRHGANTEPLRGCSPGRCLLSALQVMLMQFLAAGLTQRCVTIAAQRSKVAAVARRASCLAHT